MLNYYIWFRGVGLGFRGLECPPAACPCAQSSVCCQEMYDDGFENITALDISEATD